MAKPALRHNIRATGQRRSKYQAGEQGTGARQALRSGDMQTANTPSTAPSIKVIPSAALSVCVAPNSGTSINKLTVRFMSQSPTAAPDAHRSNAVRRESR